MPAVFARLAALIAASMSPGSETVPSPIGNDGVPSVRNSITFFALGARPRSGAGQARELAHAEAHAGGEIGGAARAARQHAVDGAEHLVATSLVSGTSSHASC